MKTRLTDDQIHSYVVEACEKNFGPISDDKYFFVEGKKSDEVRKIIKGELPKEIANDNYINANTYISDIDHNTLIQIT